MVSKSKYWNCEKDKGGENSINAEKSGSLRDHNAGSAAIFLVNIYEAPEHSFLCKRADLGRVMVWVVLVLVAEEGEGIVAG